jgi:hypothetical protein
MSRIVERGAMLATPTQAVAPLDYIKQFFGFHLSSITRFL